MYNIGPKTFQLGTGGGQIGRLVKLSGAKAVLNTAAAADRPIGVIRGVDGDGAEGDFASVHFLKDNGTIELEAASAITAGADVYDADAGRIQALPFDPAEITVWTAGATYAEGDLVVPTDGNGYVYVCTDAGDAASDSEPDWPADDTEVEDGTAKWEKISADTFKRRGTALQAASAAGSIIEVLPVLDAQVFSVAQDSLVIPDPGDTAAIPVDRSGVCAMTTAAAETRSVALPSFAGQTLTLTLDVDGGNATVTVAGGVNVAGNNTLVFANAGESIHLEATRVAGALVWRVLANDDVTLSTV